MLEVITENLDLWTLALLTKSTAGRGSNGGKLETYGIKKLRELILELAVRGRLVPQDSNDEPASELLKRIATHKAQLLKAGKIKKESFPQVTHEEIPYQVPVGWEWVRLGEYVYLEMGQSPSSDSYNQEKNGLPFFQGKADFGDMYPTARYWCTQPQKLSFPGDVLLSVRAPVGPTNVSNIECCIGRGLAALRPLADTSTQFLLTLMRAAQERLASSATGTTFAAVSKKDVESLVICIPSLVEQHRIVAKVDELMALCDQLEQQQTHSLEAHQTLVETLLGSLTRAESQQELSEAWARIASHFDTLFTTEASIDRLKQTILQLAVMGKLVPQDPNDEDVQVLLMRNDLRRREVAESDRRADVDPQKILSADDRWEIPASWNWRGLADLVLFVDYRGKTPTKQSSGIRLLTAKNVRKGQIDLMPEEFLTEQEYKDWMTRGLPKVSDVLFTTEAPMGNAAVVELTEQFALAQRVICFQNYGALAPAFLVMQMLSDQFQFILDKNGTGMTAKGIKASKLKQLPIAIPPLAEQHRIVAKVDELMALCDALKARLADAQAIQLHLADAIVEQALV